MYSKRGLLDTSAGLLSDLGLNRLLRCVDAELHNMWLVWLSFFTLGQDRALELGAGRTLLVQPLQLWPGNGLCARVWSSICCFELQCNSVIRVPQAWVPYCPKTAGQGPCCIFLSVKHIICVFVDAQEMHAVN